MHKGQSKPVDVVTRGTTDILLLVQGVLSPSPSPPETTEPETKLEVLLNGMSNGWRLCPEWHIDV
jgi:hypothetical protein